MFHFKKYVNTRERHIEREKTKVEALFYVLQFHSS